MRKYWKKIMELINETHRWGVSTQIRYTGINEKRAFNPDDDLLISICRTNGSRTIVMLSYAVMDWYVLWRKFGHWKQDDQNKLLQGLSIFDDRSPTPDCPVTFFSWCCHIPTVKTCGMVPAAHACHYTIVPHTYRLLRYETLGICRLLPSTKHGIVQ